MSGSRPTVAILGATSPISRALAERFAARGHALLLAGRDAGAIERIAADVRARHGVPAGVFVVDVAEEEGDPRGMVAAARALGDSLGGFVVAVGAMPEERDEAMRDWVWRVNFQGLVPYLDAFGEALGEQGSGFVAGIGSIAGDRAREGHAVYGAAKTALAGDLADRRGPLARRGVHVLTVKPGWIDTRMIAGRGIPRFLVASPERAADDIVRALDERVDVIYTPGWWRRVMAVLRRVG